MLDGRLDEVEDVMKDAEMLDGRLDEVENAKC